MTLATLEKVVKSVNEGPFWTTLYHDPTIHPIGRVFAAKLFHTPSGATFVAALIGMYDRAKLPRLSDKLDRTLAPSLERLTDAGNGRAYLSFNPFELPLSLMEELLESSPDFVDSRLFQERRKSAEVTSVLLRFVMPAGFVFGVLQKVGGKTTELATESIFTWLKEQVMKSLGAWSRQNHRTTMLILQTEIEGCLVEYVTSLKDELDRVEAASSVYTAFYESISIIQQLASYGPIRLVLEFSEQGNRWVPLYLVTRQGVLADRPYLEVIRARGLSLASREVELSSTE